MQGQIDVSMKIMIIDDDSDILNLFKDFLSKRGYDVITFLDPLVAIEEIENNPHHYGLFITDIRMPGISGIELIKRVCEINSDIKVMIISAFDINGDDLKEIRVEEQVQKPIHMRTLVQSIEKILKN